MAHGSIWSAVVERMQGNPMSGCQLTRIIPHIDALRGESRLVSVFTSFVGQVGPHELLGDRGAPRSHGPTVMKRRGQVRPWSVAVRIKGWVVDERHF